MAAATGKKDASLALVTGGAGFIGSHTVELLLERGHRVRVLDDMSAGSVRNLPSAHPRLEIMRGDVARLADVRRAMSGASHCLHLAAQVSVARSIREPEESCRRNILGFVCVASEAARQGVRRLVYASSAAVYGAPGSIPLSESAQPAPLSPYGLEKQVNEQYASLTGELHALSHLGLRYFNVYGPRQDPASPYAGVISIFMSRIRDGKPLVIHGDGRQRRDFIHVRDVARINVAALFSDATGVCNVGAGRSVSLLDLAGILSEAAGRRAELVFEAPRKGDIRASEADIRRMNVLFGPDRMRPVEQGLAEFWREVFDA